MTYDEEIKRIVLLTYQGQYQDALQLVEELETMELTDDDRLACQIQKCFILTRWGDFKDSLDLAHQVLQDSKILKKPLYMVDALISQGENLGYLGRLTDALNMVEKAEHILKQFDSVQPSILKEKQLMIYLLKGYLQNSLGNHFEALENLQNSLALSEDLDSKSDFVVRALFTISTVYRDMGQFDLALENSKKGLVLSEEIGYLQGIGYCLAAIGLISLFKGELDQSLEYFQKAHSTGKELGNKIDLAGVLGLLGMNYRHRGEINKALEYLQQSLTVYEDLGISDFTSAMFSIYLGYTFQAMEKHDIAISAYEKSITIYNSLNTKHWHVLIPLFVLSKLFIETKNPERAQHYIHQLQQLFEATDNPVTEKIGFFLHRLVRALFLKESIRMGDKMKALEMLQQIAEEEVLNYEWTIMAIVATCELLFNEFKYTGEEEVFNELKSWVNKLSELAEAQPSYYYLAQAYLIRSRIALLELDLNQSRKLLDKAQILADEKGLKQLDLIITIEQESLKSQWSKWERIINQKPSMSEILELTQLEGLLDRILYDRIYQKEEEIREYAARAQILVEKWEKT